MSQRYIALKMASFRELRDEAFYPSYASMSGLANATAATTTRRRLSSASLPSNRSTRAPSLRYFKHSPTMSTPSDAMSPVTTLLTPSSGKIAGLEYPDSMPRRVDQDDLDDLLALEDEDAGSGRQCRLPKEFMFAIASLVVLLTSGGLILGFGPVYSALVREQQWSEICDDAYLDSGRTCAKQEIRLQYVFSTSFLCLSAANAFFGVFLDVAGPRLTALVGLSMSTVGNFALAIGDSHTDRGGLIIVGYALIGAGGMGSYLASFHMLSKLAGADQSSASLYINYLYPVLVNGTFVYSPLVGYVIDHFGFKVVFVACLVLVQTFMALLLVPSLKIQIVTFLVYAMAQASLYALQFAYIMICFPPELYGTLQAFLASASFLIGMLNYLLNPWTQEYLNGDYTTVLVLLGLPTFVLYAFVHHVKGCEEQTIKYDKDGNPIIVVDVDRRNLADEKSQLL
ncbi:hypothetical protein ATCC90586_005519 [Pythium insidiosum]|nr:hypothetical protein ATCC90586_005519 [Pythium insidiosum]